MALLLLHMLYSSLELCIVRRRIRLLLLLLLQELVHSELRLGSRIVARHASIVIR